MFYFLVNFLLLFFQRGWEPLFVKHFKHNTVDPKCFQGSQKKKKRKNGKENNGGKNADSKSISSSDRGTWLHTTLSKKKKKKSSYKTRATYLKSKAEG